jgi:hypothetical protein
MCLCVRCALRIEVVFHEQLLAGLLPAVTTISASRSLLSFPHHQSVDAVGVEEEVLTHALLHKAVY